MAHFADYINLSNKLTQLPITDLIVEAKSFIKTQGYSQSTIYGYNVQFNDLKRHTSLYNTERLSEEFIKSYIEEGKHRSRKHHRSSARRKGLLNLISKAIEISPVFNFEKCADKIRIIPHQESLNAYEQYLGEKEIRKTTIALYLNIAVEFLLYLEKTNQNIYKVTALNVRDFVADLGTKLSQSSMKNVPTYLKAYLEFIEASVEAILFSSFRTPSMSKPVRAMSHESVEALWRYVKSDEEDFRSKSIIAILLATGMRPVDITELKLDDIDWKNDRISFIQSKTGESMNIKLFPVIGSAMTKYIIEQRPKGTGEKYIFLTKTPPYHKITSSVCNGILKNALKKSGIPYVADGLHCPRAVRRSLVSRMIAKGVPMQKAAATIGHIDDKSVNLYTELDAKKMRSICLPIPNPMKEWFMN
jgi:site-specific recombinase XerD